MMTAFKYIETTSNVERIQSYFGTMAEGQGAIRLTSCRRLSTLGTQRGRSELTFPPSPPSMRNGCTS